MYDLVAEGASPADRWRKRLPEGLILTLGRLSPPWDIPWDTQISRRHAQLKLERDQLLVTRLESATNPLFFQGQQADSFTVGPHQKFVIGRTTFLLIPSQAVVTLDAPDPVHQRSFSDDYLRKVSYRDVRGRLEILGELPNLIAGAGSHIQLYDALARLVLRGVLRAQTVGIVSALDGQEGPAMEIIHWDSRRELVDGFQPSEKLIRQAIESTETVLHVWRDTHVGESLYTMQQNSDWAFVCPLGGSATKRQVIYVSGQSATPESVENDDQLQDDMKFVQIAGATYSSLLDLRQLEHRQASLRSFFSPVVVDALAGQNIEAVLEPRECRLAILFCDLRGFSGASEELSGDLLRLLDQVSRALGVMTRNILDHRGVIGDFHGDAVMGFWGWPIEQPDASVRACHAALAIARQFHNLESTELSRDRGVLTMGLGIASGTAVAGKIGSADQVKVTAFGPVVNLASRLEGMTRAFRVPILCDETTAMDLKNSASTSARIRKLARIRPAGFAKAVELWQIMPDLPPYDSLNLEDLKKWDEAMALFRDGKWPQAWVEFENVPATDKPREFMMDFIRTHNFQPPPDWDGVIPMRTK